MEIKAIEKLKIFYKRIRRPKKPKYAEGGIIPPVGPFAIIGTRADEHEEVVPLSENQYRGREKLCAAFVNVGAALTGAAVAFARLGAEIREYTERAEKEHRPKETDALDAFCYSFCNRNPWEYYVARMYCTNKRVLHLADHAKKKRVRKKNKRRIIEFYERASLKRPKTARRAHESRKG